MIRYTEKLQIVPLLAPISPSTTANVGTATARVRLRHMQWLSFLVYWDGIKATSSTFEVTVWSSTSQASTAAGDTAIPFKSRLASQISPTSDTNDSWAAITTAAAATGRDITGASQANRALLVDVDPADIPALDSDALYAYLRIVNESDDATDVVALGVIGVFEPRFPQNANLTST